MIVGGREVHLAAGVQEFWPVINANLLPVIRAGKFTILHLASAAGGDFAQENKRALHCTVWMV